MDEIAGYPCWAEQIQQIFNRKKKHPINVTSGSIETKFNDSTDHEYLGKKLISQCRNEKLQGEIPFAVPFS